MKKSTWHKNHKWVGLPLCFFMLMFCLSGIILNHRSLVSQANVSRGVLPPFYRFSGWNGGLLRGTLPLGNGNVLIYGAGGVWLTDSTAASIADLNSGLPAGADCRSIRSMAQTPGGEIFAVSAMGLYRLDGGTWSTMEIPAAHGERLSDITTHGDSLIVVGRSHLYIATAPYTRFTQLTIATPSGHDGRSTLFRSIWRLHSGELLGLPGRLVADALALTLIFLCLTGFAEWLLPKFRKRLGAKAKELIKWVFKWHNRMGRLTLPLTLLIVFTGWCLRPPLMIPLAMSKGKAPRAGQANAWSDKLRMLRYDDAAGDWVLSTSDGFFSLTSLDGIPVKIQQAPPVSVMGLNVWQRNAQGDWLCGSFSGMSVWNRTRGTVTDYFTGKSLLGKPGRPFTANAISGYSDDLACGPVAVLHDTGTDAIAQPKSLSKLPMSLWNVALEVHTGRIYFGNSATYFFVFIMGAAALWCIWSGFKLRKGKRKRRGRGFGRRRRRNDAVNDSNNSNK